MAAVHLTETGRVRWLHQAQGVHHPTPAHGKESDSKNQTPGHPEGGVTLYQEFWVVLEAMCVSHAPGG